MPRYYFHIFDSEKQLDFEGVVLPDLQAVRVEARRFAGEVIRDVADRADFGGMLRVEVADEAERILFCIELKETAAEPRAA